MPNLASGLDALISTLVPASRTNEYLRQELVSHCNEVLRSHIGQKRELDISQLSDSVKRQLLQSSSHGSSALKFANLFSRLVELPVLSRKAEAVQFLHSLSSKTGTRPTSILLPALTPPPLRPSQTTTSVSSESIPKSRLSKGKSKAKILRDFRANKGISQIPEYLLLRDTLYLLQGISGKYVQFSLHAAEDNKIIFVEDQRFCIPPSTKALIHRLSELGYLYSRVDAFVRLREGASGVGMIEQSLCHHLQTQLTEYYRLIAVLETQMVERSPNNSHTDSIADREPEDENANDTGLSLRRLDVWINDWRLRMRMMSVCVEGAREAQGGALVNLIHSYTDNGDPFVRKFTDELLEEVSRPFFATLHKWLFSGELYDPFTEFFVSVDGEMPYVHPSSLTGAVGQYSTDDVDDFIGLRESGLNLWEAKYRFRKDMLPMFVGEAFGKKIFSTGKSLNFIRYSCHDSDWVGTREKLSSTSGILQYNDIVGLERSIDSAYRIASHRLFEVFIDKFKLLDHLSALRNYLMLGHGDFAEQLMDALGPSLARPANTLYRHNLTATLETAIRSSNAQNDPSDVLRRLDARMLEYSHGEIGWDVFTLEYKVDAPIDTVLDPQSMEKYLKLFMHLWQIKRMEMTLDRSWMRITGGARTFLRVLGIEPQWHKIRLITAEMIHFVRQLQAYCRLEVIECSWKILIDFMNKKEGDMDALIDAHRSYLDRVVKKILLWNPKHGKEDYLLNQVKEVFQIILQFREATENFYNICLSETARQDQEMDNERGVFTGTAGDAYLPSQVTLSELHSRLNDYGSSFSEKVQGIVYHLQSHPDLDCRFLAIRLSFSDFYKAKPKT